METQNQWKLLYKLGGIAPFITISLYMSQLVFIPWDNYPNTIEQWYSLFSTNTLLGLFYLNSIDMISIGLLGIMHTAMFARLKEENPSLMMISLPAAFLGIAVFIVPRAILMSVNQLALQYAEAASETLREQILAAGRMLSVLGTPTFQTAGFFILCISSLLISIVILQSHKMPKIAGYIGIAGFTVTLLDDITALAASGSASDTASVSAASVLMMLGGFMWIAWWLLMGLSLLRVKER